MDARVEKIRQSKKAEREPEKKPEPKPVEAPKGEVTPEPPKPVVPDPGPKQLRQQYEKTAAELKAKSEQVSALEKRIADAESKGKDSTALAERLATREKEYESLQAEVRALKQEASPEFKVKYDKPFNTAAAYAKRDVEQLLVANEDGTNRTATWNDFSRLYQLPKGKAIQEANQLFGDTAPIVIQHLTELQRLDYQRAVALEEEKAGWKERETKTQAEQAQQREAFEAASTKVRQDYIEKHPEWYGEDPEDKEGNELLKEGFSMLEKKPKTLRESVMLYERNKLNAAAFPRMAARFERVKAELEEAKATIEELKKSGPGGSKNPGGGSGDTAPKTWKQDLKDTMS